MRKKMAKILVVDDTPYVVNLIKTKLEKHGYFVITASDGEEAIQEAAHHIPDLIIMDIMMPRLDGTAAVERIRKDSRTTHTPVIFLTQLISKPEEQASSNVIAGNYFMAKPFEGDDLINLVRKILASR
jgi:CheY-like chemotaxis protein